jgi:hypothetical protein
MGAFLFLHILIMRFLLVLPFIFLLACGSTENKANQIAQFYLNSYSNDISEEEIQEYTNKISDLFKTKNSSSLNENLDMKACFYRGHIANDGPAKLIQALENTPIQDLKEKVNFFDRITDGFSRIDHVKTYLNQEGEHFIVYRGFSEVGINYYELLLAKKDDEIKILDIYVATSFEYISTTIYEMLNKIELGQHSEGITKTFQQVVDAIYNQEYDEALVLLNQIEEDSPYRDTKLFKIYELTIYAQLDDDIYLDKIEGFKLKYGEIPGLNLMLIDYYLLKEDYKETLQCIAELQDEYPEDHLINILKGTIHSLQEDYSSAIYYYGIAAENYPDMLELQDYLLVTYFEAADYENGFKIIDALIEAEYFTTEDAQFYLMTTYDTYLEWPEYKEWAQDKNI